MSRAFVKESDDGTGDELPDRAISPHRNLVTAEGLRQIDTQLRDLDAQLSVARKGNDTALISRIQRDLRYWSQRRSTAELVTPPHTATVVRFGTTVGLLFDDDTTREFFIVGEDEADPSLGKISYVSPVANRLLGAEVGDHIDLGHAKAEVIAIR